MAADRATPQGAVILAKLRAALPELQEAYGVEGVSLFGSVATGEAGPGSDVDLLVTFSGDASLFDLAAVSLRIEEILGHPVDVVTPGGLRPEIAASVLAQRVEV